MWLYKGKTLEETDIPEKAIGFLYLITNIKTGEKYIGKKLLVKPKYKMVNKKRKRLFVESDWKDYWSSSPYLKELIEKEGKDSFTREVLMFASGKGELNYLEECAQYRIGVLESLSWYNSNIRSRIFKKNVIKYTTLGELNDVIKKIIQ